MGEFPALNDFIAANRTRHGDWSAGNSMKRRDQHTIESQLPRFHTDKPVWIYYTFYCRNRRRDKDNICGYFHKIFQYALVERKCINNDGWNDIVGFTDSFSIDKNNPRIEVVIQEVDE